MLICHDKQTANKSWKKYQTVLPDKETFFPLSSIFGDYILHRVRAPNPECRIVVLRHCQNIPHKAEPRVWALKCKNHSTKTSSLNHFLDQVSPIYSWGTSPGVRHNHPCNQPRSSLKFRRNRFGALDSSFLTWTQISILFILGVIKQ